MGKRVSDSDNDGALSGEKIGKFTLVGISLTILDFIIYNIVLQVFYGGSESGIQVASMVSGTIATVAAYFGHSRITWRARKPREYGVVWFFGWNVFTTFVVRQVVTRFFGLFTGLYDFAYSISSALGLPLSRENVETTGVFVLMTGVIMVLNYVFYERLVFGVSRSERSGTGRSAAGRLTAEKGSRGGAGAGKCAKRSEGQRRKGEKKKGRGGT